MPHVFRRPFQYRRKRVFIFPAAAGTVYDSITANAVIEKQISQSITADAIVKKSISDSVTSDAIVKKEIQQSVTADAVIQKAISDSITANSTIKKAISQSVTADALIESGVQSGITADAIIEKTISQSVTANAIVEKQISQSITADAVVEKAISQNVTADAYITSGNVPVWVSPANHSVIDPNPILVFTSPSFSGVAHFHIQLDKVDTFDGGDLRNYKTNHDNTNWEYWDGDSWEPFPATGLIDTYSGNNCRLTITSPLSSGTWYRRVRKG